MAILNQIRQVGDALYVLSDDGRSWTAVPTTGGLWHLEPIGVGDLPPVEPPVDPPVDPPVTPPEGGGGGGRAWRWPFQYSRYVIQSGTYAALAQYGWRINPVSGKRAHHNGLDFGGGGIGGQAIPCAADGTVKRAGPNGGEGNSVYVTHPGGFETRYFHMVTGSIAVSAGQSVKAGQTLGKVGSTGNSTGAHLHWETLTNGGYNNPRDFMKARGVPES